MKNICLLVLAAWLTACKKPNESVNKFSDTLFAQLADFQDRRLSDSLYTFFDHKDVHVRHAAALAFGSIQDSLAVKKLEVLLTDAEPRVRKAAAFAIGQTPCNASVLLLLSASMKETDPEVLQEIYNGLGKVSEYLSQEVNKIHNPWFFYRMGLRNQADSTYLTSINTFLFSPEPRVRLGAAHFLARNNLPSLSAAQNIIYSQVLTDTIADVRMALTLSLRKIKTDSTLLILKKLSADSDYRVRVNAARALQAFPFEKSGESLVALLKDNNINVNIAAAEAIRSSATEKFAAEIHQLAQSATAWRVQATLYETVLALTNSKETSEEVRALFLVSENPYQKAALVSALGQSIMAFGFVNEQLHQATHPVIRSSAAAALASINRNKNFDVSLKGRFLEIYQSAIALGDAAVIGTVADVLKDPALGYKALITDSNFLIAAKNKLSLPRDHEALQPLEEAIAYFQGTEYQPVVNEFNHPIDWSLIKGIPAQAQVIVQTTKGDITLRLLVEEAPGSVANFVALMNKNYFDEKYFHRVVPNFVIQAGCNRGDGWGSEDYSIRSEFSECTYTTGSVGMASAGKDTEGTQWFITHSPTPHLDGRYTIFAEVVDGMPVVHQIEVGDQILDVYFKN